MRSITLAILWEFWRCGRTVFPATLLTVISLAASLNFCEWSNRSLHVEFDHRLLLTLHFFGVILQVIAFPTAVLIAQGQISRHYARPVTTRQIVGCHLLAGGIITAILSLTATGIVNFIFELHWPYAGPALLAVATTVLIQGTTWLGRESQAIQYLGGALAFALPILWFKSRMGPLSHPPEHFWLTTTSAELLTLASFALAGSTIAFLAIDRDRRGDAWNWRRLHEFFDRLTIPFSADRPFRNAVHAQLWFEWRQKGWWLPLIAIFSLLGVLLLWIGVRQDDVLGFGLLFVGYMLVVAAFAGGIVLGRYNPKPGRYEMGTFLATRPISDTGITGATLVTGAVSLVMSGLLWGGAGALSCIFDPKGMPGAGLTTTSIPGIAFTLFSMGWVLLSIVTCVMMTGRPRVFVIAVNVVIILALLVGSSGFTPESANGLRIVSLILCIGLAAVTLSATLAMFIKAYRRGLIGWKMALAGLAVPGLAILYEVGQLLNPSGPDQRVAMVGLMVAGLFAAPLAAGPLAVAWNRHR